MLQIQLGGCSENMVSLMSASQRWSECQLAGHRSPMSQALSISLAVPCLLFFVPNRLDSSGMRQLIPEASVSPSLEITLSGYLPSLNDLSVLSGQQERRPFQQHCSPWTHTQSTLPSNVNQGKAKEWGQWQGGASM